jgi:hypothetical protein
MVDRRNAYNFLAANRDGKTGHDVRSRNKWDNNIKTGF